MTEIVCHHDVSRLPNGGPGVVPVLMYGRRPPREGTGSVGGPVAGAVRRLGTPVDPLAFDFLTIALAVTVADTFADRHDAADGWARDLQVRVHLQDPGRWTAVAPHLERALNFLSGDLWSFDFRPDGMEPPTPQSRGRLTPLPGHDCVSLYSGGLDSAIGVLDLLADGRKPVLVSHAYPGDKRRQEDIQRQLPTTLSRFAAVANPRSLLDTDNDVQMRTRSFNFLAYGALVAATMSARGMVPGPVNLFVPENGLIALNPPLTARRIGALSTRTTHPHFLDSVQHVLNAVGMAVLISNPYATKTKGEMLSGCSDTVTLGKVAHHTVSCGKWKRKWVQCGKCVPCLIRRSSFHAAGIVDNTPYAPEGQNLVAVMGQENGKDDLLAMVLAARRLPSIDIARWIPQTGPLPPDRAERNALLDVAHKGMAEVRSYLDHLGLLN